MIHAVYAVGKFIVQTVVILITFRLGTCVGEVDMFSFDYIQTIISEDHVDTQSFANRSVTLYFSLVWCRCFLFVNENTQIHVSNHVYIYINYI